VSLPRWIAGSNPRRTAIRILFLVAIAYVVFGYVLLPVRGVGISMEPTIDSGDLIFINRLGYRFREPRRGDIVAVRLAGRSVVYVKRLLALPGDRISIDGGNLFVNGSMYTEPYARKRDDWVLPEVTLGSDDYFVLGDNRSMRMENHEMGTVPSARLIGPKAF
jgi:signal peptidase I